jgi:hypothetical protein
MPAIAEPVVEGLLGASFGVEGVARLGFVNQRLGLPAFNARR